MKAEDLKPNKILRGPIFPEPVQVIICLPMGDAVKLVGKGVNTSKVYEPILKPEQLATLETTPDSEGKLTIKTFQGRRVIIDDGVPVRAGTTSGYVYTSYLFGPGCFARGNASLDEPVDGGHGSKAVEWSRVALDSDTNLINRRRYLFHPRGVKFTSSSVAGASPTNAELETVGNWSRVFEAKNVRMVAIDHN